jgi:hypothetical protein
MLFAEFARLQSFGKQPTAGKFRTTIADFLK